jgi:Bd3614-like deaminase
MSPLENVCHLSQVLRYADAVHGMFPNRARGMLRERIELLESLPLLQQRIEREVTRVVAKRISFGEKDTIECFFERTHSPELFKSSVVTDSLVVDVGFIRGSKNGFRKVMCSADDSMAQQICEAQNEPLKGPHFHSEVILLEKLLCKKKSSQVTEIVVSLKPCKMCAALICAAVHGNLFPSLARISFLEDDPGPMAKNTLLDEFFKLSQMGSRYVYQIKLT